MTEQILQDKIRHEDCGKHCKTIYLLECFSQRIHIKEKILGKIEELANREYSSEDEEKHKKTFYKYGPKTWLENEGKFVFHCDNFMCHAPYVLRSLVERENINDDSYEQIGEIIDNQWFLGEKFKRKIDDNEAALDWIKRFANKFRKKYPSN